MTSGLQMLFCTAKRRLPRQQESGQEIAIFSITFFLNFVSRPMGNWDFYLFPLHCTFRSLMQSDGEDLAAEAE